MKIFNWVQRRFNHVPLKDDLARNAKRAAEEFTSEADKQALLKKVALVDVLGGWKDGILTIGTLGFDPVKPCNQQNEYFVWGSEAEKAVAAGGGGGGEEEAEDNIEEKQAQQYSIECDNHKNINYDEGDQICFEDEEEVNPLILNGAKRLLEEDETNNLLVMGASFDVSEVICDEKKNKAERVTLLELFLAEAVDDMTKKKEMLGGPDDQPHLPAGKKPAPCSNNGKSFAKKLVAHAPEDSQPIKKLNRLMRKMLRRKIHPDLEGKGSKMGDQKKPNANTHVNKRNEAAELVFLLPTSSGATI